MSKKNHLCPVDGSHLFPRQGKEPYFGCHCCGGMWLDHNSLNTNPQYYKLSLPRYDDIAHRNLKHGQRDLRCPDDGQKLLEFNFSGTVKDLTIDICEKCNGIWLDSDELIKLKQGVFLESTAKSDHDVLAIHRLIALLIP